MWRFVAIFDAGGFDHIVPLKPTACAQGFVLGFRKALAMTQAYPTKFVYLLDDNIDEEEMRKAHSEQSVTKAFAAGNLLAESYYGRHEET